MAHKKAAGSTGLGRDSAGRRLGVKLSDGQYAKTGMTIVKQRGSKYRPGIAVRKAKDDSLFAAKNGFVKFTTRKFTKFTGILKDEKVVNIVPDFEGRVEPSKSTKVKTPLKKGNTAKTTIKKTKKRFNEARDARKAARQGKKKTTNKKTDSKRVASKKTEAASKTTKK
jgi:large subunit ribosomal protein L27